MEGLFILLAVFIFGSMIWNIYKCVDSCFDHSSWKNNAVPDVNAHIIDIHSDRVQYIKNGAKFETTVVFSDGFVFKICKTNRKQHLLSYTISIDQELLNEIITEAKRQHLEAVRQKKGY